MEHLLTRMPRGQALDSINAFSQLRYALCTLLVSLENDLFTVQRTDGSSDYSMLFSERLKGFLRPHAEGGTAVTKADIDAFFEAEREKRAERQRG